MAKCAVFILSSPVLQDATGLYFRDECYRYLVEQCNPHLDKALIVARRRKVAKVGWEHSRLKDVNAQLVLELPDFGAGGLRGLMQAARFFGSTTLVSHLAQAIKDSDLIYVDGPSFEAWLAARAADQVNRRLVLEIRGEMIMHQDYMRLRFGALGGSLVLLAKRLFCYTRQHTGAALYVSRNLHEQYPIAGGDVEVISDVRLPTEFGSRHRVYTRPAKRYLFVGTIEAVKRLDFLLHAFAACRSCLPDGWTLELIGDGPDFLKLLRIAERLGLSSRVTFHGRIPWGPELFRFYQECDLFVMSSITEGMPRVVLEAMAFGLPVVSTRVGGIPDLLNDTALVPPNDLSSLAITIAKIANSPETLTKLSQQNWQRSQHFRLPLIDARRRAFFARQLGIIGMESNSDIIRAHSD